MHNLKYNTAFQSVNNLRFIDRNPNVEIKFIEKIFIYTNIECIRF